MYAGMYVCMYVCNIMCVCVSLCVCVCVYNMYTGENEAPLAGVRLNTDIAQNSRLATNGAEELKIEITNK